jgi:predicted Zn-dependent protease with MMP-like domain
MRVSREEFEALVERALAELPEEFREALDNVAVMVEEEPSAEDLDEVGIDPDDPEGGELLGLYQGVPLAERDSRYAALPDRVLVFRGPILRACESRREVIREIRDTVQHELGHYFGLEEDELPF